MKYRANYLVKAIIIVLIITFIGIVENKALTNNNETPNDEVLALSVETTDELNNISNYIYDNFDLFKFYADTFAIDLEDIEEQLIIANEEKIFNEKDIANKGIEYDSLELNIIEYLYELEETNPKLFNNKIVNTDKSNIYIYNLINYYSNLYDVDYQILSSIAYVESGDLKAKNMLNKNNIYGGMGAPKELIGYKNITYGVLSYVRMMKTKYFDKGLNTPEKIGYVFNPVRIDGKTTVNERWLNKVNSVLSKFDNTTVIDSINDLDSDI